MLYQNLYSTPCSMCNKVMSREDRLPPLERLWQPTEITLGQGQGNGGQVENLKPVGHWVWRHAGCRA